MPDLVEYVCVTGICESNFEKTGCERREDLYLEKALKAKIAHRAGQQKDYPLEAIIPFVFPEDIHLVPDVQPEPVYHSFVLTDTYANKSYGYCYTIYVPMSVELMGLVRMQVGFLLMKQDFFYDLPTEVFMPVSLVVLGKYPFQMRLGKVLSYIAHHNPLNENVVVRLYECLNVPGPVPGGDEVVVELFGGEPVQVSRQSSVDSEEGQVVTGKENETEAEEQEEEETKQPQPSSSSMRLTFQTPENDHDDEREFQSSSSLTRSLATNDNDNKVSFKLPDNNGLPYLDIPFNLLFECLDPTNIIVTLNCVLREKCVAFISSDVSKLTPCLETLLSLIYPLQWPYIYIPVLKFMDILSAPQSYLVGILRSAWQQYPRELIDDEVVLVDLDRDVVITHGQLRESMAREDVKEVTRDVSGSQSSLPSIYLSRDYSTSSHFGLSSPIHRSKSHLELSISPSPSSSAAASSSSSSSSSSKKKNKNKEEDEEELPWPMVWKFYQSILRYSSFYDLHPLERPRMPGCLPQRAYIPEFSELLLRSRSAPDNLHPSSSNSSHEANWSRSSSANVASPSSLASRMRGSFLGNKTPHNAERTTMEVANADLSDGKCAYPIIDTETMQGLFFDDVRLHNKMSSGRSSKHLERAVEEFIFLYEPEYVALVRASEEYSAACRNMTLDEMLRSGWASEGGNGDADYKMYLLREEFARGIMYMLRDYTFFIREDDFDFDAYSDHVARTYSFPFIQKFSETQMFSVFIQGRTKNDKSAIERKRNEELERKGERLVGGGNVDDFCIRWSLDYRQSLQVSKVVNSQRTLCSSMFLTTPGSDIFAAINKVFDWLPLGALIGGKILCVHGGIGTLETLDEIRQIKRPLHVDLKMVRDNRKSTNPIVNPPAGSALGQQLKLIDLLWSDPSESIQNSGIEFNNTRSVSVVFGPDIVRRFCKRNDIDLIIRAHQCVPNGYEYFADGHLITVFSATNYCGRDANHGAFLQVVTMDDTLLVTPKMIEPLSGLPSSGWRRLKATAPHPPSPMRKALNDSEDPPHMRLHAEEDGKRKPDSSAKNLFGRPQSVEVPPSAFPSSTNSFTESPVAVLLHSPREREAIFKRLETQLREKEEELQKEEELLLAKQQQQQLQQGMAVVDHLEYFSDLDLDLEALTDKIDDLESHNKEEEEEEDEYLFKPRTTTTTTSSANDNKSVLQQEQEERELLNASPVIAYIEKHETGSPVILPRGVATLGGGSPAVSVSESEGSSYKLTNPVTPQRPAPSKGHPRTKQYEGLKALTTRNNNNRNNEKSVVSSSSSGHMLTKMREMERLLD